ncbi:MAG TPA: thioredoxin family protein [Methanolinea sp.]|jgi:small redox-active disulfide protein 2|nr:thioredoxin family protein [Methanolinea sp.]MDI6898346.1 thioredoxin family protein [Methanolinea sp.]HOS81108.1 thioredoxin family protein [Methanolinea sp.]HPC54828.1 thioredoxin family protein [Methanolinea sp.]HQE84940.1 thioredoxin family protein [Methanolinea sp.]
MKIEILGTGCMKCRRLTKNVEQAVAELGVSADIQKVEDITAIMDRGVMLTPALIVDGELKVSGRVADVAEIKRILTGGA